MPTEQEYADLVTHEHADKPRFMASLATVVRPFAQCYSVLDEFLGAFDVDTAVGVQLDVIGRWVGIARQLAVPINDVYFTWNDRVVTGWNNGIWYAFGDPVNGISVLPDDIYRRLIKAKILSNNWQGDTEGIYAILDVFSPGIEAQVIDNQDMSMQIRIVEASIVEASIVLQIITAGYIYIKPAGVSISYEVI